MPYLIVLDDEGRKLDILPKDLSDVKFKMSPPRNPNDACTFLNAEFFVLGYSPRGGWAAGLGVTQEVDAEPFALVPLEHGRLLRPGEGLSVRPGQVTINLTNIRPAGKTVPDPPPLKVFDERSLWERIKSKVF